MLAHIQFLKMARSEGVEAYVTDQLEDLLEVIPSKKAHFRVWLECLNSQIQPGRDLFRCAIEVDGVKRKHYFAEKKNGNFYFTVNQCVDAIRKMFRREKKMMRSNKKLSRHTNAYISSLNKEEVEAS